MRPEHVDCAPPLRRWVSASQSAAIADVPHFRNSEYRGLDLDRLIASYVHDFVEPLLSLVAQPASVADVGAGYGWLALAFALHTKAHVIAIEYDSARMTAARRIAAILGVENRIEWICASIADLPLPSRSVEAVYCVEVIEHTGVQQSYVAELARISDDILIITTPNKIFPIIKHDTVLPFCHWLPIWSRNIYARTFGRQSMQDSNQFWSPFRLLRALPQFDRTSRFLQFDSYADFCAAKRLGDPNFRGRNLQSCYLRAVSTFGAYTIFFLPNLASTFRRRTVPVPAAPSVAL